MEQINDRQQANPLKPSYIYATILCVCLSVFGFWLILTKTKETHYVIIFEIIFNDHKTDLHALSIYVLLLLL
jgi:hypothetical protein